MKVNSFRCMIYVFFVCAIIDLVARFLSQHDLSQITSSYADFYEKQKKANSAIQNGMIGVFTVMAMILLAGGKVQNKMKIKVDNGQFFVTCIVVGFFMGLMDKTWVRKDKYSEHLGSISTIWSGTASALYYSFVGLVLLTLTSK